MTQSVISRNTKIPTLQSTFQKAQTSDDDKPTTETSNKRKADAIDRNSDDDEYQRPSFSNATPSRHSPEIVIKVTKNPTQPRPQNKRIPDTGFIILETIAGPKSELSIVQTSAAKQGAIVKFDMEVSNNSPNSS